MAEEKEDTFTSRASVIDILRDAIAQLRREKNLGGEVSVRVDLRFKPPTITKRRVITSRAS